MIYTFLHDSCVARFIFNYYYLFFIWYHVQLIFYDFPYLWYHDGFIVLKFIHPLYEHCYGHEWLDFSLSVFLCGSGGGFYFHIFFIDFFFSLSICIYKYNLSSQDLWLIIGMNWCIVPTIPADYVGQFWHRSSKTCVINVITCSIAYEYAYYSRVKKIVNSTNIITGSWRRNWRRI